MNLKVGVKGLVGGTKEYEVVPDGRALFAGSCQGPAPWCRCCTFPSLDAYSAYKLILRPGISPPIAEFEPIA
jgi:hypothetical protein